MNDFKIIISPAKNLNFDSSNFEYSTSYPLFQSKSKTIVNFIKKKKSSELAELMNISLNLAEENMSRFHAWRLSSGSKLETPAIKLFAGEVFRAFDFQSLQPDKYDRLSKNLRILSGLYGVLSPFDLIYPYRLEMGTRIAIGKNNSNLYEFWRVSLNNYFHEFLQDKVLINLASNEYSKALNIKKLKFKVITPIFKEFINGELKTVMMYAKNARGKMARFLIENDIKSIEEIKNYNRDGYCYDESISSKSDWIFTR